MPTTWSRTPAPPRADWRGPLTTITAWTAVLFAAVMVGLVTVAEPHALPTPVGVVAALAAFWLGWPVTQRRDDYGRRRYGVAVAGVCALPALIVVLALLRGEPATILVAGYLFAGIGALVATVAAMVQATHAIGAALRSDH